MNSLNVDSTNTDYKPEDYMPIRFEFYAGIDGFGKIAVFLCKRCDGYRYHSTRDHDEAQAAGEVLKDWKEVVQ